jgi:hypothetical protein
MNTTESIKVKNLEAAKANAPEGTRFIHTMSILDDSGTGGFCGFYATPEQERDYNDGMARMAEMG